MHIGLQSDRGTLNMAGLDDLRAYHMQRPDPFNGVTGFAWERGLTNVGQSAKDVDAPLITNESPHRPHHLRLARRCHLLRSRVSPGHQRPRGTRSPPRSLIFPPTMPNAHHPYVDHVTFAGRIIPLKRPMAAYSARRLERVLPQIAALNQAGKSQGDAAEAMGTTVQTLRNWLEVTETPWVNVKRRGPYKLKA